MCAGGWTTGGPTVHQVWYMLMLFHCLFNIFSFVLATSHLVISIGGNSRELRRDSFIATSLLVVVGQSRTTLEDFSRYNSINKKNN